MRGGRRRSSGEDYSEDEEDYRIEDLDQGSNKSSWKKFLNYAGSFDLRTSSFRNNGSHINSTSSRQYSCHGFLIHPDNRSVCTFSNSIINQLDLCADWWIV